MFDGIDRLNAFMNIINGIVDRIFSGFNGKTFVAHILKCNNLCGNLLLGQLFPGNVFVFQMIGTVGAAVDTVVGQIKRRKMTIRFP